MNKNIIGKRVKFRGEGKLYRYSEDGKYARIELDDGTFITVKEEHIEEVTNEQ